MVLKGKENLDFRAKSRGTLHLFPADTYNERKRIVFKARKGMGWPYETVKQEASSSSLLVLASF
jgi:hypothetical protein